VKELIGIKESDSGLSLPSQWDLVSDKQMMQEEQPLQVGKRGAAWGRTGKGKQKGKSMQS
jgi:hypothetical protein